MKKRVYVLFLMAALAVSALTGCQAQAQTARDQLAAAGDAVEDRAESVGETLKQAMETTAAAHSTQATHSTQVPHAGQETHAPQKDRSAQETHTTPAASDAAHKITLDEAKEIALKHAGLTADQVTQLHAEYEIEHGVPRYDVEFHEGHWEYDYEIHADTGEILSFEKDD